MNPGDVFALMIVGFVVGLAFVLLMVIATRFFSYREKKLHVEAGMAAEKAAQYAARTHELEQRVRVLEQIVTDAGAETAAQIEALRKPRSLNPATAARKSGE
jgi:Na+-transporting methylmalonyl-CoA/oxaloacetate decarboxylase gamma subunit